MPIILATSTVPVVITFKSVEDLEVLVKQYKGLVIAHNKDDPASIQTPFLPSDYKDLSPSHVVEIRSPFFIAKQEEQQHRQIHDKAFEHKSRASMIEYQKTIPMKQFTELDRRIFGEDGRILNEWEGVWECNDGTVWFLQCKHQITYVLPLSFTLILAGCLD